MTSSGWTESTASTLSSSEQSNLNRVSASPTGNAGGVYLNGMATTATSSSALTPVSTPAACASNTTEKNTRTTACINRNWAVDLYKIVNRVPIWAGTAYGTMQTYIYMTPTSNFLINQTTLTTKGISGALKPMVTGKFWCSGKCDAARGSMSLRALKVGKVVAIGSVEPNHATGARGNTTTNWSFTVTAPTAVSNTATVTAFSLNARCDNRFKGVAGKGCIVPSNVPALSYSTSSTKHGQVATHIKKALASGLEASSASNYLVRTTDATAIAANGRAACPSTLPKRTGYSCDEFPFRSTTQGAAAGGKARVPSGCWYAAVAGSGKVGYSRCNVNATQNSSAGGTLSAFYNANRVHGGDKFYVKITG